jgi:hypothetical protein
VVLPPLRRVGARTREALEHAVAQALERISSEDAYALPASGTTESGRGQGAPPGYRLVWHLWILRTIGRGPNSYTFRVVYDKGWMDAVTMECLVEMLAHLQR